MNQQPPTNAVSLNEFGRRRVRPSVVIADDKPHIRNFVRDALEDMGFIVEDGGSDRLVNLTAGRKMDLVMLGLSAGGLTASRALETLAATGFDGQIMIFAPAELPMVEALYELGESLSLNMLPLLPTPFSDETLRQAVSRLAPQEPVILPTLDAAQALRAGWLELWYQPKINARSLTIDGAEALIRMRHPTWGIVPPANFLPDPDDPNFAELSFFVLSRAAADWQDFAADHGHIELAVNLPLTYFSDPLAIESLIMRLPQHPAFEGLIVEVNSNELASNIELARSAARQLRYFNIGLSIDDLGADWPFLLEIGDCPFVEIKVDREFVDGVANDRLKQTTCRSIVELADQLGARTVAEGVETRADFVMARELGFDVIQGFFFGKPMPPRKFARHTLREPVRIN
ncbi:EAL domain-containing protein [Undibacter mobilis]|uniref:EAL domain-containing protein n=2 Tax=Undibacter mobilis TaxID=2292256 RepID=A0A371BDX3_9BRAD|nr:EAL domain-containing protein [Undibacter mobilis]